MKKISDLLFDYLSIECDSDISDSQSSDRGIKKEEYEIKNERESKQFGKPIGKYQLISIPNVLEYFNEDIEYCTIEVAKAFKCIIGDIKITDKILVVGLGNRHISSDSLGAQVVGGINITIDTKTLPKVMAVAPSVMGLTGIETVEIIEGIASKVKPTHVILIDSLCASNSSRLGRSIQITNTGVCPGGGIGNKRKCIGDNIAPKVFSIGVPLLIYASTFVSSTFEKYDIGSDKINNIMHSIKKYRNKDNILKIFTSIKSILNDDIDNMIVSIKDIEESVIILSKIISQAINIVLGVV